MSGIDKNGKLAEVLDAAALASNQMPDVFWDLDINGKELKILKFVWGHIIRLYQRKTNVPAGDDGTPRFWKGKEKMADACKVSYPTFRQAVRKLHKLGVLTSMDSTSVLDNLNHCIGFQTTFFESLGITFDPELDRDSSEYQEHLVTNVIPYLYEKATVANISTTVRKMISLEEDVAGYEALTNPPPNEFLYWKKENDENGNEVIVPIYGFKKRPKGYKLVKLSDGAYICINPKIRQSAIKIERTPQVVEHREPNHEITRKTKSERLLESIKKYRETHFILSPLEEKIMEVAHYYEYKCRVCTGTTGWRCVGKNFREHRNWKYLIRIYNLCDENKWDYKKYIDSQFDRASYWNHKDGKKYPYLNQFFSEGAIKYYHSYIKDCKEKYSPTGKAKVKTSVPQSYVQDVADSIVKDCGNYLDYLKFQKKRKSQRGFTPEQIKLTYVLDHVMSLSPYYWASLDWSVSYLKSFENPMVQEVIDKVVQYQKSKAMMSVIAKVVTEVEKHFGIVPTVSPMKKDKDR